MSNYPWSTFETAKFGLPADGLDQAGPGLTRWASSVRESGPSGNGG